ncbi:MAG: peptidylprolyl isomerase [Deltaproteobacteria bacterium]|nr:peptidylprolyl isomerase [Deltaproteobacteria bacterium]
MTRVIFIFFYLFSALLLPLSATASDGMSQTEAAATVVATVNGVPVVESVLTAEVEKQLRKYAGFGMRQATAKLNATLRKQVLDKIIDQELLRQASSTMAIKDGEEQASKKMAARQAGFKSPEAFARYLDAKKLTPEKILDEYRGQIQMDAYLAGHGLSNLEPSEEEIAAFYERAKENFKREETVKANHILIAVGNNASMEEKSKARQEAEQVLAQLKENGGQFPQLAALHSDCARTKDKGGDLGFIKRGFMPAEFDAVAFVLPEGELSGVVATRYGYHIIQVTGRQPGGGYVPLADVRDFISKYLQGEKMSKQIALHIAELRKKADIQVFLN